MVDVRKVTNKLLEAMDEGILDERHLAECCLRAMSEDDVRAMAEAEELTYFDDPDDDEDDEDDEDEEDASAINFHVIGDVGMESETPLYETTDYVEALRWVTNYIKNGNFGGYKHIELGYYNEGTWEYMDFYSPEGEDHA